MQNHAIFPVEIRATIERSADRVQLLARAIEHEAAAHVLELGVWKGTTAQALLGACPKIETYWMLDPWRTLEGWNKPFNVDPEEFEEVYQAALDATEFARDKRRILRGTTTEMVDQIPDQSLDLIYVDGDHTLKGIAIDLIAIWPKLRDGGLLIGDDFTPTIWQHSGAYEPSLVFPFAVYFAEAIRCPIMALPFNQYAIRKGPGAGFAFIDPKGRYSRVDLLSHVLPRDMPRANPFRRTARKLRRRVKRALRR